MTCYEITHKAVRNEMRFIAVRWVRGVEKHIRLGNPSHLAMPCVHIQIDGDALIVLNMSYNEKCTTDTKMPKGKNGSMLMLRIAITFALQMFAGVRHVILQDDSGFYDLDAGCHVDLSTRDMILYGKTWYQRTLEPEIYMQPEGEKDSNTLERYNLARSTDHINHAIDKKEVCARWIPAFLRKHDLPPLFGMLWKGNILSSQLEEITVEKIKRPSDMKSTWSGGAHRRVVRQVLPDQMRYVMSTRGEP